jgi:membrane protease YdiL (CAAX protease family)
VDGDSTIAASARCCRVSSPAERGVASERDDVTPANWEPPFGERPYGERTYAHHVSNSGGPRTRFTPSFLIGAWLACYFAATVIGLVIVSVTGIETAGDDRPPWFLLASALSLWVPFMLMLRYVSRMRGTGSFRDDFGLRFRWSDLAGIPIGVLSQFFVVGLVSYPFRRLFPDTFSTDKIEQRARSLYDAATGGWLWVLFIIVIIGAPVVEELVYRGFIHGGLRSRMNDGAALVIAAAWFALVHMQLAELPGLFAFGLVLGTCYHLTRRVGLPMVAHAAFNATGILFLVLT